MAKSRQSVPPNHCAEQINLNYTPQQTYFVTLASFKPPTSPLLFSSFPQTPLITVTDSLKSFP
jgi:hypothetical protein